MVENVKISLDLFVRRCLACGYDGILLQGGNAECCELCGCDFIVRPPRSYAEMEGFGDRPISVDLPPVGGRYRVGLERWLTFAALVLTGLGLLLYLGRAALP